MFRPFLLRRWLRFLRYGSSHVVTKLPFASERILPYKRYSCPYLEHWKTAWLRQPPCLSPTPAPLNRGRAAQ